MIHSLLADLVVLAHLAFIAFAALGGLLVLRWRWLAWLHLPAVLWGVGIELTGDVCPLTPLEKWLRASAGGSAYAGGFIDHYVLPLVYPPGLGREVQVLLAASLALANAALYLCIWRRRRSARAHAPIGGPRATGERSRR
jgi:hypothetical protein